MRDRMTVVRVEPGDPGWRVVRVGPGAGGWVMVNNVPNRQKARRIAERIAQEMGWRLEFGWTCGQCGNLFQTRACGPTHACVQNAIRGPK